MTFREFWPSYLREHSEPQTRAIHIAGTIAALACVVLLIVTRNWWFLPIALVVGYGPAWFAHFVIEKNRPATFKHPFLSLAADFTMLGHAIRGSLPEEVRKATQSSTKE
jgi:hypothetical protein